MTSLAFKFEFFQTPPYLSRIPNPNTKSSRVVAPELFMMVPRDRIENFDYRKSYLTN
jgi:hypothetical protein